MSLRTEKQRLELAVLAETLPEKLGKHALVSKDGRLDLLGTMLVRSGYTLAQVTRFQAEDGLWDELSRPRSRAVRAYGYARPKVPMLEALLTVSDTRGRDELRGILERAATAPLDKPLRFR